MDDTLKLPTGDIPEAPPKQLSPEAIEAWRTACRMELHRQGLLEKLLDDPTRTPRGPRFRLLD